MPRCAKLDPAELARAAKNVAWLLKNVKPEEGQWESRCRDDPRVKIFIQGAEQALPLRYPLEQSCREIEPPRALRDLGSNFWSYVQDRWSDADRRLQMIMFTWRSIS
jgi:hypothetical protein